MVISLPFGFPLLANRTHLPPAEEIEHAGIFGLLISTLISVLVGTLLYLIGRRGRAGSLFQKEAMAIVGLRPSIRSTSGFCICSRNCRAYAESDSTYFRWPSA